MALKVAHETAQMSEQKEKQNTQKSVNKAISCCQIAPRANFFGKRSQLDSKIVNKNMDSKRSASQFCLFVT